MNNCQPNCGCKFEVDSSCVRYTSINLGTTSINTGDTIETTIIKIDEAINNLQQTFESGQTSSIEGPINKIVKFGPPNTPLLPSQTFDDGISVGINAAVDPAFKMSLETSPNQGGLKISSLNNGKDAILAKNESTGAIINKGVVSLVSGSTTSNIGIESAATGASNINIGISATALGGTTNYSAQLKDGSETVQGGKFLKDAGSGKANWNYIYLSDIQDYQAPVPFVLQPATSSVLGGVKIGLGINVANDGTISVPIPTAYSLPTASANILGGVKIGAGLSINGSGVLSTTLSGSGLNDRVARWTPDSNTLGYGIIRDNGTTIGINATPTTTRTVYIQSLTTEKYALYGTSTFSGVGSSIGLGGSGEGSHNDENIGVYGYAENSTLSNAGIYGEAKVTTGNASAIGAVAKVTNNGSGVSIGLKVQIEGTATTKYSLKLVDGTQTQNGGKILRDMGDGNANWSDPNPQKFITTNYTLTSLDHGYSIIVQNGANPLNITVPNNLQPGMQVGFIQDGTGDVTFTLSGGVTLNCAVAGANKIKGRYEQAFLEQGASQTVYYLLGNVKA